MAFVSVKPVATCLVKSSTLVCIDENCFCNAESCADSCADTPPSPPFTAGFGEGAADFDAFLHLLSRHFCPREQRVPEFNSAHSKGAAFEAAFGSAFEAAFGAAFGEAGEAATEAAFGAATEAAFGAAEEAAEEAAEAAAALRNAAAGVDIV